jgi:hypothetical protein
LQKIAQFFKKICPIFLKHLPYKPKTAQISTTKLSLKALNIYIKPLLKAKNALNKPCFETACIGANVINLLKQKVAQNCCHFFELIHLFNNDPPKVAQLAKNHPASNGITSQCQVYKFIDVFNLTLFWQTF